MSAQEPTGPRALSLEGAGAADRAPAPNSGAGGRLAKTDAPRRASMSGGQGADDAHAVEAVPAVAAVPFEVGVAELERIVRELESGDLGLDQALALYERGVALVRACGAQLDAAEARLQVLTLNAEGQPILRPLEESGA